MYCEGVKKENLVEKPFTVICNNCGSHDVSITAFEYCDLGLTCKRCGRYLTCGSYNETTYANMFD